MKTPEYSVEDIPILEKKYQRTKAVVLFCIASMIVLFTYNNLNYSWGSFTVWIIQTAPVALFIPGIARNRYRSYSWLCFVILVYFINTVVDAMSANAPLTSYLLLASIVLLFICAMMASRLRQHFLLSREQNPTVI